MNQLNTPVTMTILEMVEHINSQCKPGEALVRHDDFMRKVPKVLGEDARKFSGIYLDSMNRERSCYRFPKREACLMAMSYSYELQAKVFDRMTELEERSTIKVPTTLSGALRLAAEQAELIEKQQAQLAVAEPKALAFDTSMGDKAMSVSAFYHPC